MDMDIRKATLKDVPEIEAILHDAICWMRKSGFENQWNEMNTTWDKLSESYSIDEFYLARYHDEVVACMALTDEDPVFWPEYPKGASIYLHKLAVKRAYAGQGISRECIEFAKEIAKERKSSAIRLNCNYARKKLRKLYEDNGFLYVKEQYSENGYQNALYACEIHKS